jgi:hypothetical protein
MVGKTQKSHGTRSELNSVFGLEKSGWVEPHQNIRHTVQISPHAICSTFSRSGWSVVRSASLAKGGTSKKRLSPHLHKVQTRSNKVSPRNFQTALVH